MNRPLAITILLSLGCGLAPHGLQRFPTPIWVRSHNASAVDVYLMCGDHSAELLGVVEARQSDAFEIPVGHPYCWEGSNFFLVVKKSGWGYRVGPFRPQRDTRVDLVIEKYAGLSVARLSQTQ
jgi:hypothetical protein